MMKEIVSLTMVVMETEKTFFSDIAMVAKMENASSKQKYYRYVLPLKNSVDWISTKWEKKTLQPQKCTLWGKGLKS